MDRTLGYEGLLGFDVEGWGDDAAAEVSALASIHESAVSASLSPNSLALRVVLKPFTAEDEKQQFVGVTVEFQLSKQYPASSPTVSLLDVLGMGAAREVLLLRQLRGRVEGLHQQQEPVLVASCEYAKELLTEMNRPDGSCCFCQEMLNPELESLHQGESSAEASGGGGSQGFGAHAAAAAKAASIQGLATGSITKLMSCLHCFHSSCLAEWWRWSSDLAHTSATSSSTLGTSVHPQNQRICPICRNHVLESDCARLDALAASQSSELPDVHSSPLSSSEGSKEVLQSPSLLAAQERYQQVLGTQEARGGLIHEESQVTREERSGLVFMPAMSYGEEVDVASADLESAASPEHSLPKKSSDKNPTPQKQGARGVNRGQGRWAGRGQPRGRGRNHWRGRGSGRGNSQGHAAPQPHS